MDKRCHKCTHKSVCYIQIEFKKFTMKVSDYSIARGNMRRAFAEFAKNCDNYKEKTDE